MSGSGSSGTGGNRGRAAAAAPGGAGARLAGARRRRERGRFVALLGCLMAAFTAATLMLPAVSMTRGELACGVEEHVHGPACYEQVVACGLEEGEGADPETGEGGHVHGPGCFEERLACGLPEHRHSEGCYAPAPAPGAPGGGGADVAPGGAGESAGQDPDPLPDNETADIDNQYAEEAVAVDDGAAGFPAQEFYGNLKRRGEDGSEIVELAVLARAPAGALPAGSAMLLERAEGDGVRAAAERAVRRARGAGFSAGLVSPFRVTFVDAGGAEVAPASRVSVRVSAADLPRIAEPAVVRVSERGADGRAGKAMSGRVLEGAAPVYWDDAGAHDGREDALGFEARRFGLLAVVEVVAEDAGDGGADGEDAEGDAEAAEDAESADGEAADGDDESADGESAEGVDGDGEAADADDEATEDGESADGEATEDGEALPAQRFSDELRGEDGEVALSVEVDAPEGALPEGSTMELAPVTEEGVLDAAKEQAAAETEIDAGRAEAVAVDITFRDAAGEAVEPRAEVHVAMSAPAVAREDGIAVVHMPEEQPAEVMQTTATDPATATAEFDSASFSVYALVYTVDFHWEVDGRVFTFSIPGGGFASFAHLAEALGIASGADQAVSDAEGAGDVGSEGAGELDAESTADAIVQAAEELGADAAAETDAKSASEIDAYRALMDLNALPVSDETAYFVEDIASMEFSDPNLVWAGQVGADTDVATLVADNELDIEYSANLTEEQIASINAQTVNAGDWALISLKPFDTDESLTVTMKNGDVFVVKVTDEAYDATQITSIVNGGTYALVNRANNNALLSAAHSTPGRLQAVGVTVSGDQITTTNGSPFLTKWTFTRLQNQTNQYYIQSPEGYLNMSSNGALSVSGNRQAFEVQTRNDGAIKINRLNGSYSVNNAGNTTAGGYSGYESNWNENPGEWFTLYEIGDPEVPPPLGVTIHFVDRENHAISGVTYSGGNPLVVANDDGTFKVPYSWNGATVPSSSIHLDTDFSKTGYTYANTHLAGERASVEYTYDGLVIDAELTEENNTLMFYTDCGWEGTNPRGNLHYDNLVKYDLNGSFTAPLLAVDVNTFVGRTPYTHANTDKDIYVILDPELPVGVSPTNNNGGGEDFDLTDPVYEKKLVSNGDGTYTLSLSITGRGKNISENPKANVVFIVDTSSSMQSNQTDTGHTRLEDTKDALKDFGKELLYTNRIEGKDPDTIEVAMVSFDGGVVNELDWSTDYDLLESKIDNLTVHTGTDWEDGLKEGYSVAAAKKAAEPDETTYIVFFTDGEPSNYTSFNGQGSASGGNGYRYWYSYFLSREASKDEFRTIVSSGLEMYAVFAYNNPSSGYGPTGEKGADLLHNALKYGYNTDNSLANSRFYQVTETSQLNAAFSSILNSILEYADIHDVELNDGITNLTSVGVTTSGSGPDANYTAFKYTRSGGQYGSEEQAWNDAPTAVYDSSGVHWDLSDAGVLENGVTYKVSFVVWPSQEAYDWVADLNNGKKNWSDVEAAGLEDHFWRIPDDTRPGRYRYEVKTNPSSTNGTGQIVNNQVDYTKTHSSIVFELPNGAVEGQPFEDPETHIVSTYTQNPDGTTYTKLTVIEEEKAFGPPDINMGLSDTEFKLEKIWTVNRPEDLVAFLYNTSNGETLEETRNINFDIYQSSAEHPDQERLYTTIKLGYDEDEEAFDWYGDTQVVHVGTRDYIVGTIWEEPLDIAFGLMLSPQKMQERGLDSSDEKYVPIYASEDDIGSADPIYYVLERGHDYRINEPELDYRFDFNSEVYHPMLVDSHPRDAKIDYIEEAGQRTVGILGSISPEGERLDALTAENILRGQLTLKKLVLNADGNPDTTEYAHSKEFPLTVELYNEDAPFHDDPSNRSQQNVPWYGIQINGEGEVLYYHTFEDGVIRYVDEHEACVDGDYLVGGCKPGYSGNIMSESNDYKRATVTINVSPRDVWTITNIPGGTQYTVTEGTLTNGYSFVQAEELTVVDDGQTVSREVVTHVDDTQVITGEIHSNHTTEVEFTNKKLIVPLDIELIKIDADDLDDVDEADGLSGLETLAGAVFALEKYTNSTFQQLDTDWNGGQVALTDADEDGRFSIAELPEGFYKIVETGFPNGYVKSGSDPIFEVRRDANGDLHVILLEDDPEDGIVDAGNNEGGIVKIRNRSIVVGNESGVALPHTGGSGTVAFALLGGALVVLAGVVLALGRRRRLA